MFGLSSRFPWIVAALAGALVPVADVAAADPILVEFHFTPVPNVQLAIWLEDQEGKHVRDVLVTQLVGKYGLGNRPGIWNFPSSWRAPYGPRRSVLPVWAHRRGKTYPNIIFHDEQPGDLDSLGFHENTSSAESYYCQPLSPEVNATIEVDAKTCPSPKAFNSDKGQFDPQGAVSYYPPRNDLLAFDASVDSEDIKSYAELNELDAITAATPSGTGPEFVSVLLPPELVAGTLTAYVEVSLEADENAHFSYTLEGDHYIDPDLSTFGVEYLGQPSVVYKVEFDPRERRFHGTTQFAGYGDWNGETGALHPPDGTISEDGGSGADRLQVMTKNGDTFRWGVFSYGGEVDPTPGTTGDSDSDSGSGTGGATDTGADDPGDGWGSCTVRPLAPIEDLALSGMSFDKVRVSFRLPAQGDPEFELKAVHVYHITGDMQLTEELLGAAHLETFNAADLPATSGVISLELDELWGDFTYQFAVVYEDRCTNRSELVIDTVTTEAQEFQTVDSFCFLATAAYGAPWAAQVAALRAFRDDYLKTSPAGIDLVRFYYAHSPPLARLIDREPLLRGLARVVLQPVADAAQMATSRKPG